MVEEKRSLARRKLDRELAKMSAEALATAKESHHLIQTHIKECADNYDSLRVSVNDLRPLLDGVKAIKWAMGIVTILVPIFEVWRALH